MKNHQNISKHFFKNSLLYQLKINYSFSLYKNNQLQPVMSHRRHDLYRLSLGPLRLPIPSRDVYDFGGHEVQKGSVFYETTYIFAFVNLKPVVPGRKTIIITVIIILIRRVPPRSLYPISRSHYFSHHPKGCRKLSEPGDLDNSGRKLMLKW